MFYTVSRYHSGWEEWEYSHARNFLFVKNVPTWHRVLAVSFISDYFLIQDFKESSRSTFYIRMYVNRRRKNTKMLTFNGWNDLINAELQYLSCHYGWILGWQIQVIKKTNKDKRLFQQRMTNHLKKMFQNTVAQSLIDYAIIEILGGRLWKLLPSLDYQETLRRGHWQEFLKTSWKKPKYASL